MKTLNELNKIYNLELEKVIAKIKTQKAKLVLLQFPDGLKPYATAVVDYLKENTDAEFLIWFGTCFGACDTPILGKELEKQVDLLIQFGHNEILPNY